MKLMELHEIVMKLIGGVRPVGSTEIDNKRLENLEALTGLTDKLLSDIDEIARDNKNRVEYSMKTAGKHCEKFIKMIKQEYGDV